MKRLPKIYKNNDINPKDNNKKICHLKEEIINNKEDILNEIFNGLSHPYNTKVLIKTNNKIYETYLVSKTKKNIITLDNEIIPIDSILNIEIKQN